MTEYYLPPSLLDVEQAITGWLQAMGTDNPVFEAIDRGDPADSNEPRWYVRLAGEEKEHITIWFTLGQRTLRYEAYVLPWPPEHTNEVFEWVLRRNDKLVGAHFAIGVEDAVFLRGEVALSQLSQDEMDRILGSMYAYVEQCFRPALFIGFASRFAPRNS